MTRLLRDLDYLRLIENDELLQIIEERPSIKLDAEQAGQSEMISYLTQRYIVGEIFSNTVLFDIASTYKGKNLVEYTEAAWNEGTPYTGSPLWLIGTTYALNDVITYNGYLYTSLTGGNVGNRPDISLNWSQGAKSKRVSYKDNIYECIAASNGQIPSDNLTLWVLVCADKSLFFVTLPYNQWNPTTSYSAGTTVWYLDKTYTSLFANKNIAPDSNAAFWGTGTAFSFSGVFPTDTNYFTAGDNRNQQIVQYLIDIVLFNLHSRLNPRNIPDLRKERYNGNEAMERGGAIGWLKSAAKGLVTADLPTIIPTQGLSIRFGSLPKNNNTY